MDTTSVDNNPFGISNGTNNENILATHDNTEGLLLNLTDNYKNGTDHVMTSPQDYFTNLEQTSCKRDYDEDLDDMGPETDVDAVDDVPMSPIKHEHVDSTTFLNNNPFDACSFPTKESKGVDEKETSDNERSNILESLKQYRDEENSSPVHIETGHDVSGLVEGTADSDSEDEWNYVRGEEANKENQNPVQPTPEVDANLEAELDDTMSQLNPNAIEFIPVSPTHTASPACLALQDEDRVIAQSPKKAPPQEQNDFTIDEPNDFDFDIKNKPSEIETEEPFSNGHHKEDGLENGHNGDSETDHVVSKVTSDEFHFGPNATPFTPTKSQLDESQVSTRALFGDETIATLGDSFSVTKNDDPMSMSFYQDEDTPNPFEVDLNKVQALPEDVNAFISDMNDTISDLPEHDPLDGVANPDNERLVTDLDVIPKDDAKETLSSMTDEKEVMSPLSEDLAPFKDNETVNKKEDEVETVIKEAVEVETVNVEPVVSQEDVEPTVEEKQVQQVEQSLQESMANQIEEVCEFMSKQDEPKRDVETPVEKEVELSELCDKHDEITSSVKDDLSNEEPNLLEDFSSNNLVIDTSFDTSRPYHSLEPEIRSDYEQFQQQEPLSPTEVESVTTTEVNSFLERSLPPDVASPIQSPVGYQSDLDITDPNHPLARCVYPLPPQNEGHGDGGFEERQDFHDDREVPRFESNEIVEEVEKIDTQIEEKNDETLQFEAIVEKTFNETFEPVFEHEMHTEIVEKAFEVEEKPVVIETPSEQTLEERPLVPEIAPEPLVPTETIAAVGAVATAAVVAAAAKTATTKSTPSSAKKPTSGAKSPTKPPAKQPVPPKTTSATRVGSATAKPAPRTTAAPKSASASAGRTAPSKTGTTPAARVPSAASRSLEKKPLTNGVAAKAAPARTALSARKPADLPKTTPRPAPSTTRASPLKPATTTRTTSATKTTSVSQMNGTSSATSATSRAKPPSMLSRTPATTKPATLSAPKPTTITRSPKAPLSATSTTTAPKRPTSANVGVAAPRPRPPFTARPAPKPATDAEKQNKDSANKITASRTLTSRTTSATARPPSGTVGAAKKLDAKPNATKPTSFPRTNMAAAKATAKKQLDAAKTARNSQPRAVTKPEKPKLNGTAPPTDLTELNNLVNEQKLVENGSEILGDEEKSPIIDNKLIVENLIESNAD